MSEKTNKSLNPEPANSEQKTEFKPIFAKANLLMMAGCLLLIILGFILMSGGSSTVEQFNPDIFSTRRIVVGPTIAFLGFLLMAFAIIYTPKRKK